jgi:hypothetical protein
LNQRPTPVAGRGERPDFLDALGDRGIREITEDIQMINASDSFKAAGLGVLAGLAIIIFVTGFFTCASFVLAQMGKAMGCSA